MRGALYIAVLLFSALRVQKWLLCLGGLMLVVGYLLPREISRVMVPMGLVFAQLPSLFANGLLLRYFAAPRILRLVPHSRGQLLGAMAIVVFAVTATWTFVELTLGLPLNAVALLSLWAAAAASLLFLSQFLVITSVPGMTLWFVMLAVFAQSQMYPGARAFLRWVGYSPGLLVALIVTGWVGFAFWFLRTPSFKSPSNMDAFGNASFIGNRILKVSATQETALRAFLFGNPSVVYRYGSSILTAAFVALLWGFMFSRIGFGGSLIEGFTKAIGTALCLAAYAGVGGWLVARRSKSLWLRGGLDRIGLFRLCEIQAWKSFATAAITMPLLLAVAWLLDPSLGISYTILLAAHLCAGACLLYCGLMHVRGWRLIDIVCSIALFVTWIAIVIAAQSAPKTPWLMPVFIAALAAAAGALRMVAMHRWQRIDWLVCKPPRQPARDEARLAH